MIGCSAHINCNCGGRAGVWEHVILVRMRITLSDAAYAERVLFRVSEALKLLSSSIR